MLAEGLLILFVCGSIALGGLLIRRAESSPAIWWVAGWVAAGAGAVLLVVQDAFPHAAYLAYPLGTLFPALLYAGARVLASRRVPGWLLPAALGYGTLRGVLVAIGQPQLAWWLALALDPLAVMAAAQLVFRATPADASHSERWLAASLLLLAALGAAHAAWMAQVDELPPGLLALWVVAVPALFGIQLHAEWERGRRTLRRARDELEQRVEARTQELARANRSLREEVAERRLVEDALRESEARYRVVSELGSDLAFGFQVGFDDRVSGGWVTEAYTRITGYELAELQGGGWLPLVYPEDLERIREHFTEILAQRSRDLEVRIITKSGCVIPVHARLRVSRDEPNQCFRVVGAARDITPMRQAEEERRELERHVLETQRLESLTVLTGGVAHDFNNLLTVILGNSRMAAAEVAPESTLHARLARIRSAAEHGARLTEQMLAYSGKSSVALKPIALSHLVEEMADLLRASVTENCRLDFELSSLRTLVAGDATQIQQVALNLVTNASEALSGGTGLVLVRTGRTEQDATSLEGARGIEQPAPGSYVFLEVVDDGPGMDVATQARMFEPFYTTKFSGRGLGLAAVLGIVRAHRGVVQVQSEPVRGTQIRVLFPEEPAIAMGADAGPTAPCGARRGTILVVDDQDSVVELAQIVLEAAGHRVLTAVGGRAGIEVFQNHATEIEAVLLDLTMPDADGELVLREMQRLRHDVRVIISTGHDAGTSAERIRDRGIVGFVRKPYEPEQLLDQIANALAL